MKLTSGILLMAACLFIFGCTKDEFSERDAIEAQKELLKIKYQHEIDLETLKQKGETAMQELLNKGALEQIRLNDSLTQARTVNSRKQDYSVMVTDVLTNAPIADADVSVSSEGKLYGAKTNAQGVATFNNLYLFPTSTFLVSKAGYAASQIMQQYVGQGAVRLWNSADLSNEIYGTIYIDRDLTNTLPEKVEANVLVTAGTAVPVGPSGSYSVYFPAYTKADGTYSLKIPAAPNAYTLSFAQIVADQKLFVNWVEGDAGTSFPQALPRLTTVKTYFNVNSFQTNIPYVNSYYFKVAPDNNAAVFYIPGNSSTTAIQLSAAGTQFQVERLNITSVNTGSNVQSYTYPANSIVNIEMVDITGTIVPSLPKLMGRTDANGKLMYYNSPEGGYGYIHLKRDAGGALVSGAKGIVTKSGGYDGYQFYYWPVMQLNTATNISAGLSVLSAMKGEKRVIDYHYGSGVSREKQVN